MNQDNLYLYNILESISILKKFTSGITKDRFSKSILRKDAISKRLEEVGENIRKISSKTKSKYPGVDWKYYKDMRNFLSHTYFKTSAPKLWNIVKNDIPILEESIKKIKREKK